MPHRYSIAPQVRERIVRRLGRPFSIDRLAPARTALLVVDMQNYFVAPGFPGEVPAARGIVQEINRLAGAMRAAGAAVVWIQTTAVGALEHWANHHRYGMHEAAAAKRLASLAEDRDGFRFYADMDVRPQDLRVTKIKYSAFIPDSSSLHDVLRARGVDTVLIAGTATNVCCESTARDAMMLDYRVAMVSDANAAMSDEEHAAALNTFAMMFGDVMTVDEVLSRIALGESAPP
jgi:ureidoacrylate peracid hydrolase